MIAIMARKAVIVVVLGLALALASAGAAGAVTNTGTVYHSVTVQPDSIQTITVSCPPGFIAVSGGMVVGKLLFTGGAGPLLSVTRSAAGNGFTFRVGVPVTQSAQTIKLSVRCIRKGFKIPLKALNLKIGKTTSGALVVTPGATTNKKLQCPTGQAPTGAGFDAQPADGPRRAETVRGGTLPHYPTGASARLTRSMPVNGGWEFTLHNSGTRPVAVVLEVDCLQRTYVGRLPDHRLAGRYETIFRQTSHNDIAGRSETTIHARCTRGTPLGSGFAFSPTLDMIPVTGPGRGRNQFVFDILNGEMRPVPLTEYELCREERSYIG
jgi:hypothetical protein